MSSWRTTLADSDAIWFVEKAWRSVVSMALTCDAVNAATCVVLSSVMLVVDRPTMAVVESQETCFAVSWEILKDICRPGCCRSGPGRIRARVDIRTPHLCTERLIAGERGERFVTCGGSGHADLRN